MTQVSGVSVGLQKAYTWQQLHILSANRCVSGWDANCILGQGTSRDIAAFMKPEDVASTILDVLKTPVSIAPSEYVIERGF